MGSSKRQVLVDTYGYDTKAAMNACRLCHEFLHIVTYGCMVFPLPTSKALRTILDGGWTADQFKDNASILIQQCHEQLDIIDLPDEADKDYVAELYLELIGLWI